MSTQVQKDAKASWAVRIGRPTEKAALDNLTAKDLRAAQAAAKKSS